MQIKAEEISAIIKEKIKGFDQAGRRQGKPAPSSRSATALPRSMDLTARWPVRCSNFPAACTALR